MHIVYTHNHTDRTLSPGVGFRHAWSILVCNGSLGRIRAIRT